MTELGDFRKQAAAAYKNKDYSEAIACYTSWLNAAPADDTARATIFHNCALCNFQLQNWRLCIEQCTLAIDENPSYDRAFYRRAAAYMAVGRYDDAVKDYEHVVLLRPGDPTPLAKLRSARALQVQAQSFCALPARMLRHEVQTANVADCDRRARSGPRGPSWVYPAPAPTPGSTPALPTPATLPPLSLVHEIYDHYTTTGKPLMTHLVYSLLFAAWDLCMNLPTIHDLTLPAGARLTVAGDVHGQFADAVHVIREAGFGFALDGTPAPAPEDMPYLVVLGDMVDRGSWGTEIVLLLLALQLSTNGHVWIVRGNHECHNQNMHFGFMQECKTRYTERVYTVFSDYFASMPLGLRINGEILCVHGGIPRETIAEVNVLNRHAVLRQDNVRTDSSCSPLSEILWADPDDACLGTTRTPSQRGIGTVFGFECARNWMRAQGLSQVYRGHTMQQWGYLDHWEREAASHGTHVYTVFSASRYVSMNNLGAVACVVFDEAGRPSLPEFRQWSGADVAMQLPARAEVQPSGMMA